MWKSFLSLWLLIINIFAFNCLQQKKRLQFIYNITDPSSLVLNNWKSLRKYYKRTKNEKKYLNKIFLKRIIKNSKHFSNGKKFYALYLTKKDQNEILTNHKIFNKQNYIKKYDVTKEEVNQYAKQLQQCSTNGYEPQFPKDSYRTPDGLTNIILNYKYKNDNLKIHNYYYFFLYFLKKLTENEKENKENKIITIEDFLFLKKKGFFEGEFYTWKNWIIMNRGEWKDFLDDSDYDISNCSIPSLRTMVEPKMKRMPIEYWGSFRAIDFNINHYPIYKKLYDYFNKKKVSDTDSKHLFVPFVFFPRFSVRRDRGGLGYGDANFFGNYEDFYEKRKKREKMISMEKEKKKDNIVSSNLEKGMFIDPLDFGPNEIKIEEATDIIKYPQNGRLYQKFYIGPLNITDGHTFGTLLKYVCQSQIYGYAIVAIKIHNMNEDTKINNIKEDLLEIGLNMSDICIYSKELNVETNIRLRFKGPLLLVAGMIPLPSHLQIVNKEQYICTIEEDGLLDISLKIEYGKGHWVTYEKGLYKREVGADNECMKKREIYEVANNNYIPISTSFGACRMVRITVHKIATKYWCEDRCEFTDPKQMLVVEIWCDPRMLPKNILLYGIKNIKKIFTKLKQMILSDVDFSCDEEEKELKKLWGQIDHYKLLQRKQKEEGVPPIINLQEEMENQIKEFNSANKENEINSPMNPFVQKLIDPENLPKHSNIMLPLRETPPPYLDTLEWLKQEVKKDKRLRGKKRQSIKGITTKEYHKNDTNMKQNSKCEEKRQNRRIFDYDEFLNARLEDILDETENEKDEDQKGRK